MWRALNHRSDRRSRDAVLRRIGVVALFAVLGACSDTEPGPASGPATSSSRPPATTPATTPPAATSAASTTTPQITRPTTPPTTPPTTAATTAPTASTAAPTPSSTGAPTTVAPAPLVLAVYFARGEHVGVVHRSVEHTLATSRAAIAELLGGPSAAERQLGFDTAIPAGTVLNGVSIDADGVATVDLSREFGSGGGSLSMSVRLAQLVYTVTQFASVSSVALAIEGELVGTFGSEGIVIDGPLERGDFEDVTPAILVEGPAPFDVVGPDVRVYGTANVFEAVFRARLTDSAGQVLYENSQMATSGTGTRGTFDFVIHVDDPVPADEPYTLRLWEPSARDGSDTNVIEIPVYVGHVEAP